MLEQINDTTWKEVVRTDPKDRLEVIIGDDKQPDFKPQIKIQRWDNEVNYSIRLKETEIGLVNINLDNEKIIWEKGNITSKFYNIPTTKVLPDGGYEFQVELAQKPTTNIIEFSLMGKGIKFCYQAPFTEKFKDGWSERFQKEIVVTETEIRDLDGILIGERPENVVGSYAVYCTEPKNNWSNGKIYRVGKVGHIYRPKIIDSEGNWTWGTLKIENDILSVEIPQKFLDNATYPIKHAAGATFGNTNNGVTRWQGPVDFMWGYPAAPADGDGTADSITVYTQGNEDWQETGFIKGVLVLKSNLNIVTNGVGDPEAILLGGGPAWETSEFSTAPSITNGTNYIVMAIGTGTGDIVVIERWFDDWEVPNAGYEDYANDYVTPTNPTDAEFTDETYSIYCTYTPSTTNPIGPFPTFLRP